MNDFGIAPQTLYSQIETSCPFVISSLQSTSPFILELQSFKKKPDNFYSDLGPYFFLCLSAHWASAGSFCPTDVDNAIRFNLWKKKQTQSYLDQMLQLTLDAQHWDYSGVTAKYLTHPQKDFLLSTHEGTWLSVAVGAYGASKQYQRPEWTNKIYQAIEWEMEKEALWADYWFKNDPLVFIKLTALISHNLGDFDRVIEMWEIDNDDPLKKNFYKLSERTGTLFHLACVYYKKYLSMDNHRHFAYRQEKSLRLKSEWLLPIAPFHELWGETIGKTREIDSGEKGKIAMTIYNGWKKLPGNTWGYPRAFNGLINGMGGIKKVYNEISTNHQKTLAKDYEFFKRVDLSPEIFAERYLHGLEKTKKECLLI